MIDHYVLTRSSYGLGWDLEANERRLRIFAGVTARLMARQTERRWTWILLTDLDDPLRAERIATALLAGVPVRVLNWRAADVELAPAPWDPKAAATGIRDQVAATAYRAPWNDAIGARPNRTLLTRLDDDDGFAPTALARIRAAAAGRHGSLDRLRTVWILPNGIRVWDGREAIVRHPSNAMSTLDTPAGDVATVYDYGHHVAAAFAPVKFVDDRIGWLWTRHPDTLSGIRKADAPITRTTRRLFPIDWRLFAPAPR